VESTTQSSGPPNHRGFEGLQNDTGILLVTFAGVLFLAIIVAGGLYVRAAIARDKLMRAEMKRRLEEKPL
jgi:hypothetical protein